MRTLATVRRTDRAAGSSIFSDLSGVCENPREEAASRAVRSNCDQRGVAAIERSFFVDTIPEDIVTTPRPPTLEEERSIKASWSIAIQQIRQSDRNGTPRRRRPDAATSEIETRHLALPQDDGEEQNPRHERSSSSRCVSRSTQLSI
jgi:hypothetical protein